ncbi:MAG: phosphodiesterase, partial [Bilifractor sp.]
DIHGTACYCRKMLEAYDREEADRLLLLGDILYHGPRNDLPREYAPKEVLRLLNERKQEIFCVRGNCDTEVDQMVLQFPIMADYCIMVEKNRLIYATHGHHFHLQNLPPMQSGDILLHGHTHVPAWERFGDNNLYLNPGSVSIPKENSCHGYMTLEDGRFQWKDLEGNVYHCEMI